MTHKTQVQMPTVQELLKAGVHFGHKTSKWHPSMANYIFAERKGVHIIDLEKTIEALDKALQAITGIVRNNGTVLLVGLKDQGNDMIKKIAVETSMPSITSKWIGGTMTNWPIIKRQINKLRKAREENEKDEWKKYTKKERFKKQRELEKLEKMYSGISHIEKIPEAVFFIDCKNAKTALAESKLQKITTIAICDTNVDIRKITYPIPANDDALKSIQLILEKVKEAILLGKKSAQEIPANEKKETTEKQKQNTSPSEKPTHNDNDVESE